MFIDQAEIFVRAGKGGDGCVSFRREKYMPKGGPDGGVGGNGASVLMVAAGDVDTLLDFTYRPKWVADNGRPGGGKDCTGRSAEDLVIRVPVGTTIFDRDTGVQMGDLTQVDERICVARAGRGGRGNAAYARPDHQTPREFEPGTPGEERNLRLELKLIADVGIVGLPNAGKSTLLSRLSRARPKIAPYPFTTLVPQLGIVELSTDRRFVMADIPGLIEGAHEGAGLGDVFLRHIERTRVILHLVDISGLEGTMPAAEAYHTIRAELAKYSPELAAKPEIVVGNKIDLIFDLDDEQDERGAVERASDALAHAIDNEVTPISGVSGAGLPKLVEKLWSLLESQKASSEPLPDGE